MRIAFIAGVMAVLAAVPVAAATRTFPVGGFDRVRSTVPFDVIVRTGVPLGVHAVGKDDVLARLHVSVRGGELVIAADRGRWFDKIVLHKGDRVTINVAVPRLAGAALAGPGDMRIDAVRAPTFSASLTGPGDLTIGALDAGRADISLTGPGDLTLAGRSRSARIVARGPGDLRAAGWTVGDVSVDLTGPGDVAVTALRSASVTLTGPGDVRIGGHPRCQVSKRGPGSVICG